MDKPSNTNSIKKFVERLRGGNVSGSSTPPRDDSDRPATPKAPSFRIRTPRISSPDLQGSSSGKRRRGKNGHQARDAQIALELWNGAYDALRDDPSCNGLVIAYENIISQELPDHLKMGGLNSSFRGKSAEERLDLLTAITTAGMEKRRSSKSSQGDHVAKGLLDAARDQVASVLPEYNAAAVAWPGFCTLTPLLLDPIFKRDNFRNGVVHVVGRISWYMHLGQLLLGSSWEADNRFREQQAAVREKLVKLYRKVLELEMNCVCATASTWNAGAKNVVGWNTMDKLVTTLLDLDAQVVQLVQQHCTAQSRDSMLERYKDVDMLSPKGSEDDVSRTKGHPLQTAQIAV